MNVSYFAAMTLPKWARDARGRWQYTGREKPHFALATEPGQESVWDYPRPPRLAPDPREVIVACGERVIAQSSASIRVLETAGPPTFYLPPDSIDARVLESRTGRSRCEWKGEAHYWSVVIGDQRIDDVGWTYPEPFPEFEAIRDFVSFYPARLSCRVGGEVVLPQPGGFYGGWITSEIVGPFKGEPGSEGW